MPPDHMTSPPMRFENGLETQPPLPAHGSTADTYVDNSDTYNPDLKLVDRLVQTEEASRDFTEAVQ